MEDGVMMDLTELLQLVEEGEEGDKTVHLEVVFTMVETVDQV